MLTLYAWTTPNGFKPLILLEELGIEYETKWINIGKNEQFDPAFLKVSPNNKIPALADGDLTIFESGAILEYLATREERFLSPSGPARWKALEWLYWQVGGLGPMLGQLGFFAVRSEEKASLAIQRFTEEAGRLLGVLDRRLGQARFLAGDEYTIADVATYPWTKAATSFLGEALTDELRGKDAIRRWLDEIDARPAVQRAMATKPES